MKLNKTRLCNPFIRFIWINILCHVSCYNQLVRPGFTRASSSSVGYGGYPNKTVDGDFRQNQYTYCMHTASGHKEAWLRIDLRKIYNIHSVKFWYRNDSKTKGYNTGRIQGFNIRLSNTNQTLPQNTCYQDDGKTTLPPIIEKECKGVAQYVWIYTNKTHNGGVFLEICEVQVFECESGFYGKNCTHPCGHCAKDGICDHVTGSCPNGDCEPGWKHTPEMRCDQACNDYFYGKNCSNPCGHCVKNSTCDHMTGSCPNGHCQKGWKNRPDKRCNIECNNGTFGEHCMYSCSGHCKGGLPCRKDDGICIEGCEDGWTKDKCDEECESGFYGINCTYPCGHCTKNATCDHVTGSCPNRDCEPGWKHTPEMRCDQECENGTFGLNCEHKCSGHCAGGLHCSKVNGYCPRGCNDGWIKSYCNETCKDYLYGKNCSYPCGHCAKNATCDHKTGSCPNGDCEKGWKHTPDKRCNIECNNGTFGEHCMYNCSGHCTGGLPCKKDDGICIEGCTDGWTKDKCDEKCESGFYGKNCTRPCGRCAKDRICDQVTGSCPNGDCEPGWKHTPDKRCNIECNNGTFGDHCMYNCSGHCTGGLPCKKDDGICIEGCADGWTKDKCNEECEKGFYGINCTRPCGHCTKNATCDHVTGSCSNGNCEKGWKNTPDQKCNIECDNGTFGEHCMYNCSGHCTGELPCKKDDGICIEGCADGWTKDKCDEECQGGFYGMNCSLSCGHCSNNENCNHVTGFCPSGLCARGWNITSDRKCNQKCERGFYGINCTRPCGNCLRNATCDHVTGSCPNGDCKPGWKHTPDKRCNIECNDGTFGERCMYNCSGHCTAGLPCKKDDGICIEGCADGWTKDKCDEECERGFYGINCTRLCGHCTKNATCDHVTGSCPNGDCEPGWKHTHDKRCDEECNNGTFGEHCMYNCSGHCTGGLPCKKDDGICIEGCADGWTKDKCNEECQGGFYGMNCSLFCGHCSNNENCNHVTGFCPSGLCAPGWNITSDRQCNQKCERGFYGINCTRPCGHCTKNATCDHVTGSCPNGDCEPGWEHTPDKRCNIECNNGTFGERCMYNCSGHCKGGLPCKKDDGICIEGCADGWTKDKCDEECKRGFYGMNCTHPCGRCAKTEKCDHVTGSCPNGDCEPGWKHTPDKRCDEACNDYFYGKNCTNPCGNCAKNEKCDHVNGSCPNGDCEKGWKNTPDKRCNIECDNGTFGEHCMYNCSGHCTGGLPCKKDDGICIEECADGWTKDKCNEEQLINTRTTNVSSSSVHRYFNGRGTADLTIDGNFNQYINYCMHTALDWSEAWLIVDLGDIYNVKSVKIWYRDDTGSDRAYRLRGFSILASQNPEFNENDTCYQDPGHVAPETILEVNCDRTARYIKIYTNRITFSSQYGAVLEICEIRIFGCPRWKYGERCESCGNCKLDCHATGQCDRYGCIHDGYNLPYCKECKSGRYGKDCNSSCGHCANNAKCNNITGSCPNKECAPGWKYTTDWKCDKG
ncbi:multiple epidermal growth factor-like domains protein 6 isoform X5 [Saccostrea cucullata]|uniref:multiple epidermal growth factor-like domains protein 6 isoform X5 n=1 Tax=Saccostrea cuccullata TaxID=36930 RepID=UPI002ED5B56C